MSDDFLARYGALFEADGDRVVPTPLCRGPWHPNACHGGAPSALFATVCEQHDPGSASFVARMTIELMRPVPLAPLRLSVETIRPGRKVQWLEAQLHDADEQEVARATVLRLRTDDIDTGGSVMPEVDPPPGPEGAHAQPLFGGRESPGYWLANDVRLVRGSWMEAGPGTAWFRMQCPVLEGITPSPVVRVAACADFGSGVGNALRLTNANAINAEVTIHLHRHPSSEWVCLDSGSWAHSHGVGLADSLILDDEGPVGRVAQSLVVESATRLNFAIDPR